LHERCVKALNGTAGRELLDEMKAKDERIADLERQLAEHKRDAELCRELRKWLLRHTAYSVEVRIEFPRESQSLYDEYEQLVIKVRYGGAK
jgi:hypothetical protein